MAPNLSSRLRITHLVKQILRRLLAGELSEAEAEAELRRVQLEELGGRARLDLGRTLRRGVPEIVLASGKSPEELAELVMGMCRAQGQGLGSRLEPAHWRALESVAGDLELIRYHSSVRVLEPGWAPDPQPGRVALLTAGTSDLAVADEARMVVEACGLETRLVADVGVAGLHRLIGPLSELLAWDADVIVVAAGMDGVLPGLVAGLVDRPVVGLPVAIGYGAGGRGEAALLTMLQSCATGLLVVNIGNGVGAGAAAVLIASRAAAPARRESRSGPAPQAERRGRSAPTRSSG
jgi:NCAIR mutase (PurE)-related protein